MLQVRELRKSFGSLVAVDGVSFELGEGETLGLLGPNGAGKTTTFHLLTGALTPEAGSVSLNGCDRPDTPAYRRTFGCAPQELAVYEELTGEENLAFFGGLYGLRGRALAERVGWGLEFAGLTDRRKDRVKTYSGGMQRRLNLACALLHEPELLLLDEPTVGVDPQSRNHIFESIEALQAEGRAVVYTTHYMEEAERLCDRVAIVDHGKVLALDTVDALIAQHGGASFVRAELDREPTAAEAFPFEHEGGKVRIRSEEPEREVSRLLATGVPLRGLHVERPDLEVVFLELTGRSLRD